MPSLVHKEGSKNIEHVNESEGDSKQQTQILRINKSKEENIHHINKNNTSPEQHVVRCVCGVRSEASFRGKWVSCDS